MQETISQPNPASYYRHLVWLLPTTRFVPIWLLPSTRFIPKATKAEVNKETADLSNKKGGQK